MAMDGIWSLRFVHVSVNSGPMHLRELLKDPMMLLRSPLAQKLAKQVFGSILGS